MGAPQPDERSEHGAEPMGAPQPRENQVDHDRVSRRASESDQPVGPKSSLMKPMNIAMLVVAIIVVLYGIFGTGWIL